MLNGCHVIAFVATQDPARARNFYEKVVGLRFVADEVTAMVFDANGTMLRVQKLETFTAPKHTVLGWYVPDIRAAVKELKRNGAQFERLESLDQDDHGIWTAPDATKVAWFKDPDGNVLSLTQLELRARVGAIADA